MAVIPKERPNLNQKSKFSICSYKNLNHNAISVCEHACVPCGDITHLNMYHREAEIYLQTQNMQENTPIFNQICVINITSVN